MRTLEASRETIKNRNQKFGCSFFEKLQRNNRNNPKATSKKNAAPCTYIHPPINRKDATRFPVKFDSGIYWYQKNPERSRETECFVDSATVGSKISFKKLISSAAARPRYVPCCAASHSGLKSRLLRKGEP